MMIVPSAELHRESEAKIKEGRGRESGARVRKGRERTIFTELASLPRAIEVVRKVATSRKLHK